MEGIVRLGVPLGRAASGRLWRGRSAPHWSPPGILIFWKAGPKSIHITLRLMPEREGGVGGRAEGAAARRPSRVPRRCSVSDANRPRCSALR